MTSRQPAFNPSTQGDPAFILNDNPEPKSSGPKQNSNTLPPLTLAGININGERSSHYFLRALMTNPSEIGAIDLPTPNVLITVESWQTTLHPPMGLGACNGWTTYHKQHPNSSDANPRGQGGLVIRLDPSLSTSTASKKITMPSNLKLEDSLFLLLESQPPTIIGAFYFNHTAKPVSYLNQTLQLLSDQMLYIKTKFPNSPIVLFGDWNLRLGNLTRDHHCNNTHLNAFTSFLGRKQPVPPHPLLP
jgi:hypothetical protein